jgi:Ca2+/H+ antiporter, TMEM165/GDT1 family
MMHVFWTAYVGVFAAEVLGDRFLYTTGILATRYRTGPMMLGISIAFMGKMGVAVAIGGTLAGVSRFLVAGVTAAGVAWIVSTLWRSRDDLQESAKGHTNQEAAMVSCASVLFSEWADLGQLTAAALAAQFRAPMIVWVAAVAAMMTKALVVATIGSELRGWLRRHLPEPVARYGSLTVLVVLGVFSVMEALLARR